MKPLLQTIGLFKQFAGLRGFGPIDFYANPGETVGIIGPNGSGKTTFFNVVTGFLKPTSGQVLWQDQDITNLADYRRARLGLVRTFQEKMVFQGTSVRENLQFALIQHGKLSIGDLELTEVLAYVGLPNSTIDQKAGDLSWGQSRLLGMALSLVMKPRLMLLDEPFAGLNRVSSLKITNMLQSLKKDGIGIVIVEHEMSLLLPLCDRVVVFADGQVLAEGSSHEILQRNDVRKAYFGEEIVARD